MDFIPQANDPIIALSANRNVLSLAQTPIGCVCPALDSKLHIHPQAAYDFESKMRHRKNHEVENISSRVTQYSLIIFYLKILCCIILYFLCFVKKIPCFR
jgi:hypothetical protein